MKIKCWRVYLDENGMHTSGCILRKLCLQVTFIEKMLWKRIIANSLLTTYLAIQEWSQVGIEFRIPMKRCFDGANSGFTDQECSKRALTGSRVLWKCFDGAKSDQMSFDGTKCASRRSKVFKICYDRIQRVQNMLWLDRVLKMWFDETKRAQKGIWRDPECSNMLQRVKLVHRWGLKA